MGYRFRTISLVAILAIAADYAVGQGPLNLNEGIPHSSSARHSVPIAATSLGNSGYAKKSLIAESADGLMRQSTKSITASFAPNSKTPYRVQIAPLTPTNVSNPTLDEADLSLASIDAFRAIEPLTGVSSSELIPLRTDKELGWHLRYSQVFNGIPVYGAEMITHFNGDQSLYSITGHIFHPEQLKGRVSISSSSASSLAIRDFSEQEEVIELAEEVKSILEYEGPEVSLAYYPQDNGAEAILSWLVEFRPNIRDRYIYAVEAETGRIIDSWNQTALAAGGVTELAKDYFGQQRSINVYRNGKLGYLIDVNRSMFEGSGRIPGDPKGVIHTMNAQYNQQNSEWLPFVIRPSSDGWDGKGVSAHYHAGRFYEMLLEKFDRTSIDGTGGNMLGVINITNNRGEALSQAFWNGKFVGYGNGNWLFNPFCTAADIVGHEFGHGVIEHTAGLELRGEAGALNEAYADLFGHFLDGNYTIGENVINKRSGGSGGNTWQDFYSTGYIRDFSDPHNGGRDVNDPSWHAKHVDEMVTAEELGGSGDIHKNSGIITHVYYKVASRFDDGSAASQEKKLTVQRIFYSSLFYLSPRANFLDCRYAVESAAHQLTGVNSDISTLINRAFDEAGIALPEDKLKHEFEPVKGDEYIVAFPVESSKDLGFRLLDAEKKTLEQDLTQGEPAFNPSRPSVTDNGQEVFYVNERGSIDKISLSDIQSPVTSIAIEEDGWETVSISKDGLRLALTKRGIENAIYAYDQANRSWERFEITNSSRIKLQDGSLTSLKAKEIKNLEWNFEGDQLVFDCLNEYVNASGETSEVWDIGFLSLWDIANETFKAIPQVYRPFEVLSEYRHSKNPTFAKNSGSILAYDEYDSRIDKHSILGWNLSTGAGHIIVSDNGIEGYPSYSGLDDKLAFHTVEGDQDTALYEILLKPNKIEALGLSPNEIYQESKLPVWFTRGIRDLSTGISEQEELANSTSLLRVYPNPTSGSFSIVLQDGTSDPVIQLLDFTGKTVLTRRPKVVQTVFPLDVNLPAGHYIVRVLSQGGIQQTRLNVR